MSGTLTIYSQGDGLIDGHSWISYTPDGGSTTTYGTWGNDPTGSGNGLFEDLELGRTGEASRSAHLDDKQESQLFDVINKYKSLGQNAWSYLSPCSAFAAAAWNAATGEKLDDRGLVISNPSTLKKAIEKANGALPSAPTSKARSSLRSSPGSSTTTCPISSG